MSASNGQFEFGDVVGDAFRIMRDDWQGVLLLSLLLVALPNLAFLLSIVGLLVPDPDAILGEDTSWAAIAGAGSATGIILLLASFVLYPAAIMHLGVMRLAGKPVPWTVSLKAAMSRILPLVGVCLLAFLGMALGTMLLIVPGVILYCGWFVFLGPAMLEDRGPTEALGRSWELTTGYKWWMLLVIIVSSIIGGVAAAIFEVPFTLATESMTTPLGTSLILPSALSSIGTAISYAVAGTFAASTFTQLRTLQGGIDQSAIADVFS